jgi:hypothetical protein
LFLSGWALPHYSGKALQRYEWLAQICPVLQLVDGNVIARLAARAVPEECARYIDHLRRTGSLVKEWRSTSSAEIPCRPSGLVSITRDFCLALGYPKAAAPAADVGRIGRTMRTPRCAGMIVPGPSSWKVDLDVHFAAKAFARRRLCRCFRCLCRHCRFGHAGPHQENPVRDFSSQRTTGRQSGESSTQRSAVSC